MVIIVIMSKAVNHDNELMKYNRKREDNNHRNDATSV